MDSIVTKTALCFGPAIVLILALELIGRGLVARARKSFHAAVERERERARAEAPTQFIHHVSLPVNCTPLKPLPLPPSRHRIVLRDHQGSR